VSSLIFFAGFGAMVLGSVLFLTGVWHESVLRAGFMLAPGPLLAGLCAFPGGLLGARFSQRAVGTVGSLLFAASAAWWVTRIGAPPDYAGAYLPGSLIGGTGVGLMLPSLGGAATAPLPPERFATGTALYAMCRQIGLALGVACLVAILGVTTGPAAVGDFHHAWIFMGSCALISCLVLQGIGRKATMERESLEVFVEDEPYVLAPSR
jgi:MFS family permease